ncbi:MAG: aminopeptidase [Anaerolineales bacterium]
MTDPRVDQLARLLVEYSAGIQPGDRVLIEAEIAAEPLVRALFEQILHAGGHPHLLVSLEGMTTMTGLDSRFIELASDAQLDFPPAFMELAYEQFESRIRVHSSSNTKVLANSDPARSRRRSEAVRGVLRNQFDRGQRGDFRWVTTLYPTEAYAQEADMSLAEYTDFVWRANHVIAGESAVDHWRSIERDQASAVAALNGAEQVHVFGPNCDLRLSVKGRTFLNSCGHHNMPDGEIYTGPVEDSANGWVQFTYPSLYQGRSVSGVRLTFENGRVVESTADKGEDFLRSTLETDAGARYLGEFAIGTNFGIDRFTGNILFDEKIGGSFHMALGAGYPETGSISESAIHWDMICDLQQDSQITVDGELYYENGAFTF